jgi:hypothetical protein
VSGLDDYESEMFRRLSLDDDTVEDLLAGRDPGQADLTVIAAFLEDARAAARGPAPDVTPRLAALMADRSTEASNVLVSAARNAVGPESEAAEPPKRRRKESAIAQTLTGLGFRAKAAIGLGVAVVAVTGAGAAGALPGPAQHVFAVAVCEVTPFHLPHHAHSHAGSGKTASSDATGTRDGQRAVDGPPIASTAADDGLNVAPNTLAVDPVQVSVPEGAHNSGNAGGDSANSNAPHTNPESQSPNVPQTNPESQSSNAPQQTPGSPSSNAPGDPGSQRSNAPQNNPGSQGENAPDDPGSQRSNGIDAASTTPAGSHVPPQVVRSHP